MPVSDNITVELTVEQFKAICGESGTFLHIVLDAMGPQLKGMSIAPAPPPIGCDAYMAAIKNCGGNKIAAIKEVRSLAYNHVPIDPTWGFPYLDGLKDAKDFVEKYWNNYWSPIHYGQSSSIISGSLPSGGIVSAINKAFCAPNSSP